MVFVRIHQFIDRLAASLRLSAVVAASDLTGKPTARVPERNAVATLESIADDADSGRGRITVDTDDGRTLVISATENFTAVEVTDAGETTDATATPKN